MNERYTEARLLAIKGIESALIAHKNGDLFAIAEGLDEYDSKVPRSNIEPNSLLMLTLEFWAGWSDCAIHDWKLYEPILESDWPRMACVLLENLRSDSEITSQEILDHFIIQCKPNKILNKLKSIFSSLRI